MLFLRGTSVHRAGTTLFDRFFLSILSPAIRFPYAAGLGSVGPTRGSRSVWGGIGVFLGVFLGRVEGDLRVCLPGFSSAVCRAGAAGDDTRICVSCACWLLADPRVTASFRDDGLAARVKKSQFSGCLESRHF